jgi:hypothetical protein
MERVKIIEKILASSTGRPPSKRISIVDYLMSCHEGVLVQRASSNLKIASSTIEDTFRCLKKLGYLEKIIKDKEVYIEERYISERKRDVHRLPYVHKLNQKFYDDFNRFQGTIRKDASDKLDNCKKMYEDTRDLSGKLEVGIRCHVAAPWAGIWNTSSGRLEIKGGYPITGKYPNGTIKGKSEGGILTGTWREGRDSGIFEFTMAEDRSSFSGKRFSRIKQPIGEWNGVREKKRTETCVEPFKSAPNLIL